MQRVRLRLLGVYATHQHDGDGDGFCMDAFRRQDLRLGILVRKVWRGVLGSLPGSVRGVDVDVGCGRHFEREKGFWLERVEGRRKRRLRVRVGGCLDWYGVEVLEGWVRRVLGGGGWEAEGEVGGRWVLVEGVGGRRVEEVGRVSGDGGVEWGEVWGSYAGRGWVEEV